MLHTSVGPKLVLGEKNVDDGFIALRESDVLRSFRCVIKLSGGIRGRV